MRANAVAATIAAYAGLGPPIGAVLVIFFGFVSGLGSAGSLGNMLLGFLPALVLVQPIAFHYGELPALCCGIAVAFAACVRPALFLGRTWVRSALSGCMGAIFCAIWDSIFRYHVLLTQSPGTIALNAMHIAAIGGVVSALIGSAIPVRSWIGAPSSAR
jgi:hypothetical protein